MSGFWCLQFFDEIVCLLFPIEYNNVLIIVQLNTSITQEKITKCDWPPTHYLHTSCVFIVLHVKLGYVQCVFTPPDNIWF